MEDLDSEFFEVQIFQKFSWPWNDAILSKGQFKLSLISSNHCTLPVDHNRRSSQAILLEVDNFPTATCTLHVFPETSSCHHWQFLLAVENTRLIALRDFLYLLQRGKTHQNSRDDKYLLYCSRENLDLLLELLRLWAIGILKNNNRAVDNDIDYDDDDELELDEDSDQESISSSQEIVPRKKTADIDENEEINQLIHQIWTLLLSMENMKSRIVQLGAHVMAIMNFEKSFQTAPLRSKFLLEFLKPVVPAVGPTTTQILVPFCNLFHVITEYYITKHIHNRQTVQKFSPIIQSNAESSSSETDQSNEIASKQSRHKKSLKIQQKREQQDFENATESLFTLCYLIKYFDPKYIGFFKNTSLFKAINLIFATEGIPTNLADICIDLLQFVGLGYQDVMDQNGCFSSLSVLYVNSKDINIKLKIVKVLELFGKNTGTILGTISSSYDVLVQSLNDLSPKDTDRPRIERTLMNYLSQKDFETRKEVLQSKVIFEIVLKHLFSGSQLMYNQALDLLRFIEVDPNTLLALNDESTLLFDVLGSLKKTKHVPQVLDQITWFCITILKHFECGYSSSNDGKNSHEMKAINGQEPTNDSKSIVMNSSSFDQYMKLQKSFLSILIGILIENMKNSETQSFVFDIVETICGLQGELLETLVKEYRQLNVLSELVKIICEQPSKQAEKMTISVLYLFSRTFEMKYWKLEQQQKAENNILENNNVNEQQKVVVEMTAAESKSSSLQYTIQNDHFKESVAISLEIIDLVVSSVISNSQTKSPTYFVDRYENADFWNALLQLLLASQSSNSMSPIFRYLNFISVSTTPKSFSYFYNSFFDTTIDILLSKCDFECDQIDSTFDSLHIISKLIYHASCSPSSNQDMESDSIDSSHPNYHLYVEYQQKMKEEELQNQSESKHSKKKHPLAQSPNNLPLSNSAYHQDIEQYAVRIGIPSVLPLKSGLPPKKMLRFFQVLVRILNRICNIFESDDAEFQIELRRKTYLVIVPLRCASNWDPLFIRLHLSPLLKRIDLFSKFSNADDEARLDFLCYVIEQAVEMSEFMFAESKIGAFLQLFSGTTNCLEFLLERPLQVCVLKAMRKLVSVPNTRQLVVPKLVDLVGRSVSTNSPDINLEFGRLWLDYIGNVDGSSSTKTRSSELPSSSSKALESSSQSSQSSQSKSSSVPILAELSLEQSITLLQKFLISSCPEIQLEALELLKKRIAVECTTPESTHNFMASAAPDRALNSLKSDLFVQMIPKFHPVNYAILFEAVRVLWTPHQSTWTLSRYFDNHLDSSKLCPSLLDDKQLSYLDYTNAYSHNPSCLLNFLSSYKEENEDLFDKNFNAVKHIFASQRLAQYRQAELACWFFFSHPPVSVRSPAIAFPVGLDDFVQSLLKSPNKTLTLLVGAFHRFPETLSNDYTELMKSSATQVVNEIFVGTNEMISNRICELEQNFDLLILAILNIGVHHSHSHMEYMLYPSFFNLYKRYQNNSLVLSRLLRILARMCNRNPKQILNTCNAFKLVLESMKRHLPNDANVDNLDITDGLLKSRLEIPGFDNTPKKLVFEAGLKVLLSLSSQKKAFLRELQSQSDMAFILLSMSHEMTSPGFVRLVHIWSSLGKDVCNIIGLKTMESIVGQLYEVITSQSKMSTTVSSLIADWIQFPGAYKSLLTSRILKAFQSRSDLLVTLYPKLYPIIANYQPDLLPHLVSSAMGINELGMIIDGRIVGRYALLLSGLSTLHKRIILSGTKKCDPSPLFINADRLNLGLETIENVTTHHSSLFELDNRFLPHLLENAISFQPGTAITGLIDVTGALINFREIALSICTLVEWTEILEAWYNLAKNYSSKNPFFDYARDLLAPGYYDDLSADLSYRGNFDDPISMKVIGAEQHLYADNRVFVPVCLRPVHLVLNIPIDLSKSQTNKDHQEPVNHVTTYIVSLAPFTQLTPTIRVGFATKRAIEEISQSDNLVCGQVEGSYSVETQNAIMMANGTTMVIERKQGERPEEMRVSIDHQNASIVVSFHTHLIYSYTIWNVNTDHVLYPFLTFETSAWVTLSSSTTRKSTKSPKIPKPSIQNDFHTSTSDDLFEDSYFSHSKFYDSEVYKQMQEFASETELASLKLDEFEPLPTGGAIANYTLEDAILDQIASNLSNDNDFMVDLERERSLYNRRR